MKFVELVVEKLGGLFQQHGLQVSEQFTNYIKFESGTVAIAIGRDFRDNSTSASTGPPVGPFSTLNNDVLQHIFNSNINIENCTPDVFLDNLKLFFESDGKALMRGEHAVLKAHEQYIIKLSKEHTEELLHRQNLQQADTAWSIGDYRRFIKYLDKTDWSKLPRSYELKYKMALDKLK
jgi:hypothetical protein